MRLLTVRHATTYRYARPVTFGPHRLMLRPRDSHDLRLVSAELTLSPPGNMRWMHDVFGNSVALVEFTAPAPMLSIASTLKIERYGIEGPEFPIAPEAECYPFIYSSNDRVDLGRLLEQHYPDLDGVLASWANSFVTSRPMRTLDLLTAMNAALKPIITYVERHEQGTQSPTDVIIAGNNLIRVAVTRDPSQAIPIIGSFNGDSSDFLGMNVEVTVTAQG
jgi:transglutaminase-like putative cysteine protease